MRFNLSIFLFLFLSPLSVIAQTGPQPGDIYREYSVNLKLGDNWRVTDPNATHSGAAEFLPNPILSITIDDLENAVRAEVLMDIWGGHAGTTGRKFRFNDSAWIDIPLPSSLSDRSKCYLSEYNVTLDIPLNYLKEGENFFQGTSGGQVCNDFGWGQWGWYVMMVRVYYSPDKIYTKGRIGNIEKEDTLYDYPTIIVEADDTASVSEIQLLGKYIGYDEDGDGIYDDWHRAYHEPSISGHIGTKVDYPYEFKWNTRYIPDQELKSVSLIARIKDTSDLWYVTETIDSLSLVRPDSLSVKMYTATGVQPAFSVRAGNSKFCYIKVDSMNNDMEAWLFHRTWNAGDDEAASGTIAKPLVINGEHGYKCYGKNHFYALSNVHLAVGDLIEGFNTVTYSSNTVHHGIEVLWPGPAIIIRYVKDGDKIADLTSIPADSFVFKEPFYPTISTDTEGALIYYTTDGTDPNPSDNRYRRALLVQNDITIQARAFKTDYSESDILTITYFKDRSSSVLQLNNEINLYPNPVNTDLTLDIPGELGYGDYYIFNSNGSMVIFGRMNGKIIPVDNLKSGLYLLQYKGKSNSYQTKFLVD